MTQVFKIQQEEFWSGEFGSENIKPNDTLVDYGFSYNRDLALPQGDITWFLMEKQ